MRHTIRGRISGKSRRLNERQEAMKLLGLGLGRFLLLLQTATITKGIS